MGLVKRAKLFVFLRENRHEIFDESFQMELSAIYRESSLGRPPVPPARLALATVLQAYTGVSDDEAMVMDRRWRLVLECLGADEPPFSKWSLVNFRKRLIAHGGDCSRQGRLFERAAARRVGFLSVVGSGKGGGHVQPPGTRPEKGVGRDLALAGTGAGGGRTANRSRGRLGQFPQGGFGSRLVRPS